MKSFSKFSMSTSISVYDRILSKLTQELSPIKVDVINESYKHNVPEGSETHFKVLIVSHKFEDKKPIDRHRLVNQILSQEFPFKL